MADKPAFTHIIELTRDEAIAVAMLTRSGLDPRQGFVANHLNNISRALLAADDSLNTAQFKKWEEIGAPYFELKDSGDPYAD